MRIQSQTKLWATEFISENKYGEQVGGYTNLVSFYANVQYMSNELEYQNYGEITNSTVQIRTDTVPPVKKGTYVYLTEPEEKGTFTIGDITYKDYGKGEYQVDSIKPTLIGVDSIKNKTLTTARKI